MEERQHGDTLEHRHKQYDYWHPATRVHSESTKDQLPTGHVLSKKPLAEKLILDRVEVTPIQTMGIGASLEIGAVQSLMEGLQHHRYAASTPIIRGKLADNGKAYNEEQYALFYAEWEPNNSDHLHRYIIEVRRGEDVYVGYFPFDGRKPRLYGIHHKKLDVIKFLHKTHSATLQVPELTLLTELNIPNIRMSMDEERYPEKDNTWNHTTITHKQGSFFTRSIYGEFIPLSECKFIPAPDSGNTPETVKGNWEEPLDATGFNMGNPRHPWYMFQGATGYIQLYEGKMFCYPDGSIRFLTKEQEESIFRRYTDLQIMQGDLLSYEGANMPSIVKYCEGNPDGHSLRQAGVRTVSLDRHHIESDKAFSLLIHNENEEQNHPLAWSSEFATNSDTIFVDEDCTLTITHPEHGETKYEALKGEMLALLPGTSRPFQKNEERD